MGNVCLGAGGCCNPDGRSSSAGRRKTLEKPFCDLSLAFPSREATVNHVSLAKMDSAPSCSVGVHGLHPAASLQVHANSEACLLKIHQDPAFTASTSSKRNFVSRIPPLGRSGSSEHKHGPDAKIVALFEKYRDKDASNHDDAVLAVGIEALCHDLEMKPDEFRILLLAWKCNAEQMCRLSRKEFVDGCRALKADSIRSLQVRLTDCMAEVANRGSEAFKDLYRFTFRFGLASMTGIRTLPLDMAISLWQLVFSPNEPPILPRWLHFLQTHPHLRGIQRDTWNMFLNFIDAIGNDLSSYDDTEAWPSLFDDFVEFEHDQANQNYEPSKASSIQQQS